ncbi:MAG: cell division protein FtsL [Firmicutes bacterium]|nr:cell division protein FtsL [Bacillota bacterium]
MMDKPENKKRKRFSWLRLIGVAVAVLLLIKLCQQYDVYRSMVDQLEGYQQELAQAESEYQAALEKNELMYNDSYIERLARENLGMVKPGEIRVSTVKVDDAALTAVSGEEAQEDAAASQDGRE